MLTRNIFTGYFVVLMATCLLGCVPTILKTKPKMKTSPYLSVIYDPMLTLVKVGDQRVRLKGDMRQFSAEITNINNMAEKLSYKFKFYDNDGFEIKSEERPWLPVTISAYELTSIQVVAPSKRAMSAKLFIEQQK